MKLLVCISIGTTDNLGIIFDFWTILGTFLVIFVVKTFAHVGHLDARFTGRRLQVTQIGVGDGVVAAHGVEVVVAGELLAHGVF